MHIAQLHTKQNRFSGAKKHNNIFLLNFDISLFHILFKYVF